MQTYFQFITYVAMMDHSTDLIDTNKIIFYLLYLRSPFQLMWDLTPCFIFKIVEFKHPPCSAIWKILRF